jgi:hypothetical protein
LGENGITRIKELVIVVLLPPSLSRRVCVCLKLRVGERKRRRERKDNASQNGVELGEEDVEDAERKSKEIKAPSSLLGW